MDRMGDWRPIEPAEPADGRESDRPAQGQAQDASAGVRLAVVGVLGVATLAAAGFALWASTPQPQVVLGPGPDASGSAINPAELGSPRIDRSPEVASEELLIDVQGAVVRPGLHSLPHGSRVGDAIAAAGGYGLQIDIRAAAERLNLAERLTDGAKIHVPARGDPTPPPAASATNAAPGGEPTGGGLIEINSASQMLLETLPGIGPVTAGKIIAAREEARFTAVDELLARKVVGPATFEKIRALVTVEP